MDTLSIVTLALTAATFLLAIAAFWAIWQNYQFRKDDIKKRVINRSLERILNWAEKSLVEFVTPESQLADNKQLELLTKLEIANAKGAGIFEDAKRVGGETERKLYNAQKAILDLIAAIKNGKFKNYTSKEWIEFALKLGDLIDDTIGRIE